MSGADPHDRSKAEEIEELRRSVTGLGADIQGLQHLLAARQRELDQLRGTLSTALLALRGQLEQIERSAAWRYGHGVSRAVARARGRRITTAGGVVAALGQVDRILELLGARRSEPARSGPAAPAGRAVPDDGSGTRPATLGEQILLAQRLRDALGPAPSESPEQPLPPVATIVVSRSPGRVRPLLERLAETDYPAIEAIVIDNASADGEVAQLVSGRAQVERLETAASFAEASNRGAQLAESELLLFLNDDIHPAEPGWLRELVASLIGGEAAIAGATLVDPSVRPATGLAGSGWIIEQRGIELDLDEELFAPVRRESGADLFGGRFGLDAAAVAVSGACMLVPKDRFLALGMFDTGYQYGLEDVDLCLRARTRGHRVLSSGRSVVVHEGAGSQREAGREFRRINRAVNRRRFRQLWGPTVRRERLDGLLRGEEAWGTGPRLAIARTSNDPERGWGDYYTSQELGEAAQQLGWRVSYLEFDAEQNAPVPVDLDLAIVLTDRWDARRFPTTTLMCAWIRNWTDRWLTRPWLDRYDVLLASSQRTATLLHEATGRTPELFPLASNPRRFRPPRPGSKRGHDWVFTGNRWGQPRAIEGVLGSLRGGDPAVYGRGWDELHPHRLARGALAFEELPAVYASAKLVLDDTAEPTLAYDAVNARVFDALACGALPVTNCERGVRELFDDDFPTWSSPQELSRQVEGLLAAPARRAELAARYRQVVLARHTYEHRVRRLRQVVAEQNARLSFCLKIGAPDREQAERWGDLHFATSLGRALRRLGHRWKVDILPEWDAPGSSAFDVVVHLRGRSNYSPAPGQFNVLWLISHPESFEEPLAEGFDLVCVASEQFAAQLRARLDVPVRVLEQATDPRLFFPDPDGAENHELVFVGNSRGVRRKILDDLLPTDHDLAIWGSGWKGTAAERHLRGDFVPNDELRKLYSSAQVVLCDHWPGMRAAGFRSNRLYDALACGAVVVSDRVAGLDGSLGDAVVTYDDPAELAPLLERVLRDPAERARRASGARVRILAGETFDDRARDLLAWVEELMER
jgi:GT2 family glycosyltransferase/spore maturation protein CgeB